MKRGRIKGVVWRSMHSRLIWKAFECPKWSWHSQFLALQPQHTIFHLIYECMLLMHQHVPLYPHLLRHTLVMINLMPLNHMYCLHSNLYHYYSTLPPPILWYTPTRPCLGSLLEWHPYARSIPSLSPFPLYAISYVAVV